LETTSLNERKSIHIETKENTKTSSLKWLDDALRRLMDVVGAGIGLILLSPAFVLIALVIRHDSPGPIFYRGRRAGKGEREFKILKFRTMYEEEKSHNGSKITAKDDPRITPTGRWLRETKVNELPQLWNVLKGEMSFVGPRPEDPDIVKEWTAEDKRILLSVRPGVTSPATFIYRDEEQLLSTTNVMQDYIKDVLPTKLRLDKLYLRNRSITTDMDVMFWTAVTMLPSVRTLEVPQHYLYWGPVSRITMRYLSWWVIDTVIAFMAVGAAGVLWRLSGPLNVGVDRGMVYALGISILFSLTNWLMGLNRLEWSRAPARNVVKLGFSAMLATGLVLLMDRLIPAQVHLPVMMILLGGMLALGGFTMMRYRERLITGTASRWLRARGGIHNVGERTLKVGSGENGALASWLFEHTSLGKAINLVGIVDDDPRLNGLNIDGKDVLGTTSDIPELVERLDIGLIVYTIDNIQPHQRERILSLCHKTGAKVVVLPDILDIMRKEFRVNGKEEPCGGGMLERLEVDQMLGEVQSLLAMNKTDEAFEQLAKYRKKIRESEWEKQAVIS
jgi:lipopolysaccharide/colanic/teichoic acid biosynthesis glycosyltransferase